jgi:hypothetical protein
LEVADIVCRFGESFRRAHPITPEQSAVLVAIERCRTAALGGHLDVCHSCGFERPAYNSCRNRHCPKCQALAQAKWTESRLERVLPVRYFHVVFTLPAELRAIAKLNREKVFDLLFQGVSDTLQTLGRDPKRLGAQLGITMVLHTWTRELEFHPHVHAIVTGGGLSTDRDHWIDARRKYLFPVRVMGTLFRGKFLAALEKLLSQGQLRLPEGCCWKSLRDALYRKHWIVYAKEPFGGAEQVIRYLGRYTHRIGISNRRLVSMSDTHVTFRTKDGKRSTVTGELFLQRFVQHVLPHRFVKIRHAGLMASGNVSTKLARARSLLEARALASATPRASTRLIQDWKSLLFALTGVDIEVCPHCHRKTLERRPLPLGRAPPEAA